MKKKTVSILLTAVMALSLAACGASNTAESSESKSSSDVSASDSTSSESKIETADSSSTAEDEVFDETTVTVFAAKSLNSVMEALISEYNKTQPKVKLVCSYDSSGTLMTQIEEGASCDVFFSAAAKQMDQLEGEELLVEGTRHNIVNNQVCVVTYEGSNTQVTGLEEGIQHRTGRRFRSGWKIYKRGSGKGWHPGKSRRCISNHNPAGF